MTIIKPKLLKHGDVIGICAPASSPASEEKLSKGICYLEQLGFRIELGKNIFKRRGYLAGTDEQRAEDVNQLFANRNVKAIFTARGGYGSHRVLPLLNYKLIKNNPKILVGYSDITALHFALLTKCGLVTFFGPMVSVEMSEGLSGNTEERFWKMLMSTTTPFIIKGKSISTIINQCKKTSTGRLIGGNLTIITALIGTKFIPKIRDPIFILEEIDERPYRIDRMLQQMKLSGILRDSKGIALGNFRGCEADKNKPSLTLGQVFKDTLGNFTQPIISGIPFGHFRKSVCLPIGVRVKIDGMKNCIKFLESAVIK